MRVALFTLVLMLDLGLAFFPWVGTLDQKLLDVQFRFLRAQALHPVKHDVVIVGIDDETTKALREPLTLWHPHLGKFLQAVAKSGAAAVGIDVVLPTAASKRSFRAMTGNCSPES